jgi:lipoprotein-anchoring transpeptidase ErfK/SrfK
MEQPMKYQQQHKKHSIRYHLSVLLISGLALCLLLLSACSPSNSGTGASATPTSTLLPTPTIDASLQNQGETQLQTFQQWITLLQQYGGDTASYQQQYNADQQALQNAKTSATYKTALTALNAHVEAIKLLAMKTEAQHLLQQLQQQVTAWGQTHQYHDAFNNTSYPLGYEYGTNGMGGWVQDEVNTAQTMADYQQAIEDINTELTNFQAMTANTSDTTPYNQPHNADRQLMQHYDKMNGKVLVVSLQEQAMRVYDHGQLVNAFQVTTGRPDKPSLPGLWWVEGKQSPTVFKAGVPKSSPYWYPDTPINFAIQYHSQGYFIHDSWWRADYGPGTNFPHQDATGDPFSAQGSHGCVNMAKDNASWVYGFVVLYTSIIVY